MGDVQLAACLLAAHPLVLQRSSRSCCTVEIEARPHGRLHGVMVETLTVPTEPLAATSDGANEAEEELKGLSLEAEGDGDAPVCLLPPPPSLPQHTSHACNIPHTLATYLTRLQHASHACNIPRTLATYLTRLKHTSHACNIPRSRRPTPISPPFLSLLFLPFLLSPTTFSDTTTGQQSAADDDAVPLLPDTTRGGATPSFA